MKRGYPVYLTAAIVAVLLAASVLAAGCNTQATPTPTPTKTPKPTFTATPAAPTRTSTPYVTNTPVPPTPVPGTPTPVKPTNTPVPPTATPKPPTPTSPPAPTAPPKPPTNTPVPPTPTPSLQYRAIKGDCVTHGGSTSVIGFVYRKGATGQSESDVINGVWIRWWVGGSKVDAVQSGVNDVAGRYHMNPFAARTEPGTWNVAVVADQNSTTPLSDVVTFTTSGNADPGACNDQIVDFQSNF